jgi:hypothetical protein
VARKTITARNGEKVDLKTVLEQVRYCNERLIEYGAFEDPYGFQRMLDQAEPSKRRKRGRPDLKGRDLLICAGVLTVAACFDVSPVGNEEPAKNRETACSIVAKALDMPESVVRGIFRRRMRRLGLKLRCI